jgi:hypothetical protein
MAASPRLDLPGSSLEAEFGGTGGGVRESPIAAAVGASASAPPKATAAPTGTTKYTYTGLCDALNAYEQSLVKAGTVEYANQYAIEFAPASLASSGIVLPGTSDKKMAPGQQTNTAKNKVLPETNTFNSKGKNIAVSQGTQIIQFIELTMRNSRYITDQLLVTQDQVTGNSIPSTSITTNKTTSWFKITVNAVPVSPKIDKGRNDYAYKITYSISTYALNEAQSQYFPEAQFRGVHKVYNYWFTGQNTQILSYEQSYNNQYINVLSSKTQTQGKQGIDNALSNSVGYGIGLPKNVPSPRSGQSDQQAENGANNPASTLADYLYSFSDQSEITLQIVGDPAWLVQAEPKGITAKAFEFGGFYSDGTVNPEVQQIVFAVNWNAPSDYNNGSSGPYSGTGLMEVNASNTQGNNNNLANSPMQASAAYTATQVRSTFSKGKFTQELKGNALKNLNPTQLASVARRSTESSNPTQVTANQPQSNTRIPSIVAANNGFKNLTNQLNPNLWNSEPNNIPVASPNLSQSVEAPPIQPQSPAGIPTSNGGLNINIPTGSSVTVGGLTLTNDFANSGGFNPAQAAFLADEKKLTTEIQSMAAKDA